MALIKTPSDGYLERGISRDLAEAEQIVHSASKQKAEDVIPARGNVLDSLVRWNERNVYKF